MADSGGPPAHGRWAGGASPPLRSKRKPNVTLYYTLSTLLFADATDKIKM